MTDARKFPIQTDRNAKPYPTEIPWYVADLAYSAYSARYGREQSLERLAERGGFSPSEMDDFLPDWRERCDVLRRWQRWAAYCFSCARSGETDVLDFEQFVAQQGV